MVFITKKHLKYKKIFDKYHFKWYYTINNKSFKGAIGISHNNIRLYRAMKNISQNELAKATGLSQQTISNAERTSIMSLTTAKKIADYFGVSIDDIFLLKNTI